MTAMTRTKFEGHFSDFIISKWSLYENFFIDVETLRCIGSGFKIVVTFGLKNFYPSLQTLTDLHGNEKKNQNGRLKKKVIFQLRQFSIFFNENFMDWSLD